MSLGAVEVFGGTAASDQKRIVSIADASADPQAGLLGVLRSCTGHVGVRRLRLPSGDNAVD